MRDIAGVVILYYPDQAVLFRNIQSYLTWLDRLYVIDNSSQSSTAIIESLNKLSDKIRYIPCPVNIGIAAALNKGAKMALDDGYGWLLTMDQDSYFEQKEIEEYFLIFSNFFFSDQNVAVIAPLHNQQQAKGEQAPYKNVAAVITSGSLLQLSIWKTLGGYLEKLFLDEVDHEYCYRAVTAGYYIIEIQNVYLNHQLGKLKKTGYLNEISRRNRTIHSPERVYYMVRNYLYVKKKYKTLFPEEFRRRDRIMATTLKNNLLFGDSFIVSIKNIFKGYRDFRNENFSDKT